MRKASIRKLILARYFTLYAFIVMFAALSFIVRLSLVFWNYNSLKLSLAAVIKIFFAEAFFIN